MSSIIMQFVLMKRVAIKKIAGQINKPLIFENLYDSSLKTAEN